MSTADDRQVSPALLIALGVIVGLAALYALWTFVISPLLSTDAGDEPQVQPSPGVEVTAEPEATPEPAPIPETIEVFSARDPFQQLVQAPVGGGTAPGDGTTPAPGTTPTPGTTPSPSPTVAPTVAPSPGATPTAPPGAQVGATSVRLIDVFTDDDGSPKVLVQVNGTGFEVGEGDTFAQRFRVLDISGQCATFLFGDNRFTLCRGEEIRK